MADTKVLRNRGEGKAFWVLDGLYEVKLSSEETDGKTTVMEMTIPPGKGPVPHTHEQTEDVYVLEGNVRFRFGDETHVLGPGSQVHIPAGTLESFEPAGKEAMRVLVTYKPGGMEKFFEELGEPAKKREIPAPSKSLPSVERIAQVGKRYGLAIPGAGKEKAA